ncbi:hypothetical protein ACFQY7_46160 [Actinomadura luteofluorescens]|uniref:hypothetical protein n=1 Tax=Actinomadura luteofluorescens TaxID=46163 RepID=UPI00362A0C1E
MEIHGLSGHVSQNCPRKIKIGNRRSREAPHHPSAARTPRALDHEERQEVDGGRPRGGRGFQGWNPAGRSPEPLGRAWRLDAEWNRKGDPLGHADIGVTATVRGVSLTLCEQFIPDFAMNENLIANARVQQRLQILNALN